MVYVTTNLMWYYPLGTGARAETVLQNICSADNVSRLAKSAEQIIKKIN